MRRRSVWIIVVFVCIFTSCTAEQLQNVKKAIFTTVPKLLATITTAYGGPYSALIGEFFSAAGGVGGQEQAPAASTQPTAYQQNNYPQAAATIPDNRTASMQGITETTPQKLEIGFNVVKEGYENGRYNALPVADGATLNRNDNYKILFSTNTVCYVYIAQLDSTGKMDPIFPSSHAPWGNPVEPVKQYSVPPDKNWFYLDENIGVETIYFIVSLSRRTDIEQLFNKLAEKNKTLVQRSPVSIDSPVVITRGIGGVRPGQEQTVVFNDGSQGQYSSTLLSSIQADFVATRWFNHQ
jgi:hypothetical protein